MLDAAWCLGALRVCNNVQMNICDWVADFKTVVLARGRFCWGERWLREGPIARSGRESHSYGARMWWSQCGRWWVLIRVIHRPREIGSDEGRSRRPSPEVH